MSQIESGKMPLSVAACDASTLISSTVESFETSLVNRPVSLSCSFAPDPLPLLLLDEGRVRQVWVRA